jgi:integrase
MTRDTIYGDWGCSVFDTISKEKIGSFCADAGLVSVFHLTDVLKYNPEYNDHIEAPHCVALIENFKGTVQFVVKSTLSKAGLADRDLSTHKLRHTAATLMYQHGNVDVLSIKEILGHENLNTTQIYTHVMPEKLKETVSLHHPLSNTKGKK